MQKGEKYIILASVAILTIVGTIIFGNFEFSPSNTMEGEMSDAQYLKTDNGKIGILQLELDNIHVDYAVKIKELETQWKVEKKNLQSRLSQSETTTPVGSDELNRLKSDLVKEQNYNSDLKNDIQSLKSQMSKSQSGDKTQTSASDTYALKQTIKSLKSQLESEKSKKVQRGDSSMVKNLRDDLRDAENEVDILTKNKKTLTDEKIELEKDKQQLERTIKNLERDIEKLEK